MEEFTKEELAEYEEIMEECLNIPATAKNRTQLVEANFKRMQAFNNKVKNKKGK